MRTSISISDTAYRQILREYDEKQLNAARDLRERTAKIEQDVPQLRQVNSRIAEVSVNMAVMRVRGQKKDLAACQAEREDLIRKKKELLEQAGYSLRDLEPRYQCAGCRDTGYVDGEKCSCLRSRMIEILYDQSNIKEILKRENFQTYTLKYYSPMPLQDGSGESPLSLAKKAQQTAYDFVNHFQDSSDNLIITGGTGTGKTFLSNCIAREILDAGYSVIYLSAVKLFGLLAEGTFRQESSTERDTDELYSCDLLIIDDLGTELTNSFVQSAFFNCINERLLRNRHTIISTNLSLEQISINYSERISSRIAERYKYIKLFGSDIRISKKMEE